MDKKMIGIVVLSMTAAFMLAIALISQPSAQANVAVIGRDYQAVTTHAQQGGDALYILDTKTGLMAVFLYDSKTKLVRVRDVRPVRDAFAGH